MKTLRFYFRLFLTLLIRYKILVFLGFMTGIVFFFFFPLLLKNLPKLKTTEKIAIIGRFPLTEIPDDIQNLVSLGLTTVDETGKANPGLASDWKIENEGKTYTFTINTNYYWHDKTNVVASDVNYNFADVEIYKIDNQTIQFKLKEAYAPFLNVVSKPLFKKGYIGFGDYKINKITKNGEYLQTIFLTSLSNSLSNLEYHFYPTEESAKTALKLKEVGKISNLTNSDGWDNWQNIKITSNLRNDRFVGLFFNLQKPQLGEKALRQALAYALEKNYGTSRALGPISPLSWAYSADVKPYDYDLVKAKSLLKTLTESNKDFKVTLKLLTVSSLLNEAEGIKKSWEKLGVKVEIGSFNQAGEDFDVLLAIQQVPLDPDQYAIWHSTQGGNITHMRNARIDKLLEDARKLQNVEERKNLYYDFQRFLVEELPVIFLYHPTAYDIERI
jgi:peptide/nickel transport system substrate-binding protein